MIETKLYLTFHNNDLNTNDKMIVLSNENNIHV